MRLRRTRRQWVRLSLGLSLGLSAVGACAGAMQDSGARAADPDGLGGWSTGEPISSAAPDAAAPDGGCPHGALEDPHRGFVRCLEPGEVDAAWLPPPPQPEPPADAAVDAPADARPEPDDAAIADAAPDAMPLATPPPPVVEVGAPSFLHGEVPGVVRWIERVRGEVAKCVAENGGLSGSAGHIELQFLVRARGRAEGVEVLGAKGVTPAAQRCVRVMLKNRPVGTPTADPVGVTIKLSLKAAAQKK